MLLCKCICRDCRCFFFNDTATTEIYTLSLHDALPICKNGKGKKVEKALEEHCTTIYQILPSGRIERQQRFFDDVLGKFHDKSHYPMCVVQKTAEGKLKALYTTRQGEKEKTVQLMLVKFDSTTYRLDLKNEKDGQIWKLQFNPSKTSVTVTRPNQDSLVLIR